MKTIHSFESYIKFEPSAEQIAECREKLNLHYLNDKFCNKLNYKTQEWEPKYPEFEKEHPEFKSAHYMVNRNQIFKILVHLKEDGSYEVDSVL